MKKLLILALSLAAVSCGKVANKAEIITYRGWENCVRLSNDSAEIIVNPAFGGHILYFGLNGGDNILYADTTIDGASIDDHFNAGMHPDAGRFDIGNERLTQKMHDTVWAGPYTPEILSPLSMRVVSLPDNDMGIVVERIYALDPVRPLLTVTQKMTNISDTTRTYCFWTRTLVPLGGTYMTRVTPTEQFPAGFGQMNFRTDTANPYFDSTRMCLEGDVVCINPGGQATKLGFQSNAGWSAYAMDDVMYVKYHAFVPGAHYDNNKGASSFPNIIYMCERFIEIEPNSPMLTMQPGETASFEEKWLLVPLKQKMKVKDLIPIVEAEGANVM